MKRPGSRAVLLPLPKCAGSLLPDWQRLKAYYREILTLMENGVILSASVVKEGGAAACIAKMCFGNRLGFSFSAEALDKKLLFAPNAGAMIAEMDAVSTIPGSVSLGVVTETPEIVIDGQALPARPAAAGLEQDARKGVSQRRAGGAGFSCGTALEGAQPESACI